MAVMDRLDAMAVFAAVCDANGFAPGARRLGLSPSTVTRLVAALEEQLGVRLLHRTTRSLHLTEAGERYLDRVRRILADVDEADEAARGERTLVRGRLVVTAPVIFGRLHVAPLLRRYMQANPEVTAELLLNDRNVHLIEEGVDVAVRIGALDDSSLATRLLGRTRRVVVGSPDYLSRRGRPEYPADLERHDIIVFGPVHAGREWNFTAAGDGTRRDMSVAVSPRLATNSGDAALDFVRDGLGLTRALLYQVVPHLATGELEVVLDRFEPAPSPIQAVYPTRRLVPAKVRAFVDLAAQEGNWNFAKG